MLGSKCSLDCNLFCDPGLRVIYSKIKKLGSEKEKSLNRWSERCINQGFVLVVILWSREDNNRMGEKKIYHLSQGSQLFKFFLVVVWNFGGPFHFTDHFFQLFCSPCKVTNIIYEKTINSFAIYDAKLEL
jgi:hypothetical protein